MLNDLLSSLSTNALLVAGIIALSLCAMALFMRPRRFYFVRHGESMLNKEHIKQAGGGSLSPKGRLQAEAIGRALAPGSKIGP